MTASGKLSRRGEIDEARAIAKTLGVRFVPYRRGVSVAVLLEDAAAVMSLHGDALVLVDAVGEIRWSTGMAEVRIRRLEDGIEQDDHVLKTGALEPGDQVLDCTLGLAQDALVMAHAVGARGRVVGLERSRVLHAFAAMGLGRQRGTRPGADIECIHTDAAEFLARQARGSFDCVYFDPMFSKPTKSQPGFAFLRRHADLRPLTRELLGLAQRVARRWVVVKAAAQGGDLHRLGLRAEPFKRSAELRFARLPGGQD